MFNLIISLFFLMVIVYFLIVIAHFILKSMSVVLYVDSNFKLIKIIKRRFTGTVYGVLIEILRVVSILLFIYPWLHGLIDTIEAESVVFYDILFNIIWYFFIKGGFLFLKLIPVQIVLISIIYFVLLPIHNKKIESVKQDAEMTVGVLCCSKIDDIIKKNTLKYDIPDMFNNDGLLSESIYLPSTEHCKSLENQLLEATDCIKKNISNSKIPMDSNLRLIAKNNQSSLNDLINVSLEELKIIQELQRNIEETQFPNCVNSYTFFEPLYRNTNGLINLDLENNYSFNFEIIQKEFEKNYGISKKGYIGEQKVSKSLDLYKDVFINLENIRFQVENTTVEADNIVISDNGVFCIETKNYGKKGETIVITKDGKWKHFKGKKEVEMSNVTEQHNRHIGIMQRTVNEELRNRGVIMPYIYFKPIYIIANDEVEIENNSDLIILRASNVCPYIQSFQDNNTLSKEMQSEIKSVILAHKQDLIKYELYDYKKEYIKQFSILIKNIEYKDLCVKVYQDYIDMVERNFPISIKTVNDKKYITLKF